MKRLRIFAVAFCLPVLLFSQNITITHGPYLQKVGEEGVTVIWTTDKDAVSWVELAPAGNDSFYSQERPRYYDTVYGNKVVGRLHRVTITGLTPGTEYRYRIFSKEVSGYEGHRILYGNIAVSDVYSRRPYAFRTSDSRKEKVSFRVVNDIHGNNDHLRALLSDVERENTDLVIFNGDMVSTVNEEEGIFRGFMDTAVALFASEVPMYYVRGNHETRGRASSSVYDYFPTPTGAFYYAFRKGPVFFLVLDSGEDKPDSDIEYSELACFDDYRSEESKWLETMVMTPEFRSAKYRIVLMHMPPVGSSWHGTREVARKFVPLLNDAGIDLMICGHTHEYGFVGKGSESGINFPVLINDDKTCLQVEVSDKITVKTKDLTGKILHTHTFYPQK